MHFFPCEVTYSLTFSCFVFLMNKTGKETDLLKEKLGSPSIRLQVIPLLLGLSCMMRKITMGKNGRLTSWGREVF